MKINLLLFLFVFFSKSIFACACFPIWTDEEVFNKTELIFIGTVIKIDTLKTLPDYYVKENNYTEDSTNTYTYAQFVTFTVKKVIKGHLSIDTIIIMTGIGGGDCGYTFQKNKIYIVHTNEIVTYYIDETTSRRKLLKKPIFETNICKRTTTEIKKELKFLRKFLNNYHKLNGA